MSSTGIDRRTGRILTDCDHVVQSLEVIFTTHFGEREMRRTFGSNVPPILGRENIVPSTFLKFATAIIVSIELFEPRFRIKQVTFPGARNSPEGVRRGKVGMAMLGEYRPRGHLGDPTPDGEGDRIEFF
jgi:phage baseplate assembly protein W